MSKDKWTDMIIELQSLAQAGLTYGRDDFDLERYARIRNIAAEMMSDITDIPKEKVRDLFCSDSGYQTPKIDTRAAIFKDGRILLVHERNGFWSLPGGWCELFLSVSENTVKEVREETGLSAEVDSVIAIHDRERHNTPHYAYGVCKIFTLCHVTGGSFEKNIETTGFDWFTEDELPPLAVAKNSEEQVRMCFEAYRAGDEWKVRFD